MRSVFIVLLCLSFSVHARMYQWTEPGSGTTQLSGKPPAWYRSEAGGPRVFVFEKGRLIDDTAINVSYEERYLLRQRAFIKAEEDLTRAKEKLTKAEKMKKKFEPEESEKKAEEEEFQTGPAPKIVEIPELTGEAEDEQQEKATENMRELIIKWEALQTKNAKEMVKSMENQSQ